MQKKKSLYTLLIISSCSVECSYYYLASELMVSRTSIVLNQIHFNRCGATVFNFKPEIASKILLTLFQDETANGYFLVGHNSITCLASTDSSSKIKVTILIRHFGFTK
jgi:hypothetical protein